MIKLEKIIKIINPIRIEGESNRSVAEIRPHDEFMLMDDHSLSWLNKSNLDKINQFKKGIIICPEGSSINPKKNCTYIFVNEPRKAFSIIMSTFFKEVEAIVIHSTVIIDNNVSIGKNVAIGPNTVIEKNCIIGDNTVIGCNNVIKRNTVIEENVRIGSNNTIGDIGFGYEKNINGEYKRIQHIGNVIIKKNVEISNNICIDRAVLGSTIIGENSKIDNLVHIAHGVKIGKNSLIIANSMIAGSAIIGSNVWIAPSSSILNKLVIKDNSIVGLAAVVLKDVEENSIVAGNPAKLIRKTPNV